MSISAQSPGRRIALSVVLLCVIVALAVGALSYEKILSSYYASRLKDADGEDAWSFVSKLRGVDERRAEAWLIEKMLAAPGWEDRERAARALAEFGGDATVEALLELVHPEVEAFRNGADAPTTRGGIFRSLVTGPFLRDGGEKSGYIDAFVQFIKTRIGYTRSELGARIQIASTGTLIVHISEEATEALRKLLLVCQLTHEVFVEMGEPASESLRRFTTRAEADAGMRERALLERWFLESPDAGKVGFEIQGQQVWRTRTTASQTSRNNRRVY